MDGTGRLFADFIGATGSRFDTRIVRYPQDEQLSYAEVEEFARSATDGSEPFVIVAESFSTPIAIRWAASAPMNLKGLVLCAGFVSSPLRGLKRLAVLAVGPILFRWKPPNFVLRWLLVGRGADPSLLRAVRVALADVGPKVLAARLRIVLNCDERMELQRLNLPILFIRPTQDRLLPASAYEQIRAANPGFEMREIDSAHLVLQANPRQCAELISKFVGVNS
jgi:pimeloyl-ACP methyl ester carboxylesterase